MTTLSTRALAPLLAAAVMFAPAVLPAQSAPSWASAFDTAVTQALATARAPGATVAIVHDGRLVYAKGYGLANVETRQPMDAGMLLRVGSVTKMFTGAMLAALAERGQLDLQQPIDRYVTTLAGKRVGTVTTHQLMTHSAGWIDNAVAYGRMGEGALGEVMREVGDTLFFTDAGRTFSYSNPSISMAGYVGEVAGKQRYASLVESLVLRPAGMMRSTFKPLEALTWPMAMGHQGAAGASMAVVRPMTENTAQWGAGFLFATAPELARFATMLMQDGALDGKPVLPTAAVRRMTTGYVPHPGGSGLDSAMYGYGLVVGSTTLYGRREPVWTHGGAINGYNAEVYMLPARRSAVVVLVNGPGSGIAAIRTKALELSLGVTLAGRSTETTRPLTAAERAQLAGVYAMGRTRFELREDNGTLRLLQNGASMPVLSEGASQLVATSPEGSSTRLFYRVDSDGRVPYLYVGSRALARQP